MNRVIVCLGLACALSFGAANAGPIQLVVADPNATQPAINDSKEVVYLLNGSVISTTRGLLVDSTVTYVDASNLGLSNSGEVVYSDGTSSSQIISTTRGVLVSTRSFGATISATTGEVAYIGITTSGSHVNTDVYTTTQGLVETFDELVDGFRTGVADVNDLGEVVFELRLLTDELTRLYSTTRGFLTPVGISAIQPAINNLGEVVYSGFDSGGRQQIFSTERGQLTFFEGKDSVFTADLPDIDSKGRVVFRGLVDGVGGLYEIKKNVPEPATIALLGIALAGLGVARRRKAH